MKKYKKILIQDWQAAIDLCKEYCYSKEEMNDILLTISKNKYCGVDDSEAFNNSMIIKYLGGKLD